MDMSFASRLSQSISVSLLLSSVTMLMPQLASAQQPLAPAPSLEPLEIKLLQPDTSRAQRNIVTANSISPIELATPSLWWVKQQFDEDKEFGSKFIVNWIAYQDKQRVDLVVNRQLWTLLDYIGRYRFVNQFGTVARDYKYDVRVFNQQAALLATYTCDHSKNSPPCEFRRFEAFGRDSLQVPRKPLGG
jgi:hypothetical protein